jgi:hypothetical protein
MPNVSNEHIAFIFRVDIKTNKKASDAGEKVGNISLPLVSDCLSYALLFGPANAGDIYLRNVELSPYFTELQPETSKSPQHIVYLTHSDNEVHIAGKFVS